MAFLISVHFFFIAVKQTIPVIIIIFFFWSFIFVEVWFGNLNYFDLLWNFSIVCYFSVEYRKKKSKQWYVDRINGDDLWRITSVLIFASFYIQCFCVCFFSFDESIVLALYWLIWCSLNCSFSLFSFLSWFIDWCHNFHQDPSK